MRRPVVIKTQGREVGVLLSPICEHLFLEDVVLQVTMETAVQSVPHAGAEVPSW